MSATFESLTGKPTDVASAASIRVPVVDGGFENIASCVAASLSPTPAGVGRVAIEPIHIPTVAVAAPVSDNAMSLAELAQKHATPALDTLRSIQ